MRKINDYEEVFSQICEGMKCYLDNNNIYNVVLGLSGGLDSTVVAALMHAVKHEYPDKPFRLIGVSMPTDTNGTDENSIANLCKHFCSDYIFHPIESDFQQLKDSCEFVMNKESTNLLNGNIKARIRMIILYHIAGANKGLVLDTDNLTEHYLGFFTIHGDVADLNPIGDLWKHEVYELAEYMCTRTDIFDESHISALKAAIKITPTDGNGVMAGGDMAQIAPGCTYDQVDRVIEDYRNYFWNVDSYIKDRARFYFKDISEENIRKIVNRINNSEFKRHKLPIKIGFAIYDYDEER